jgi:predicted phosphodiesterase
MDLHRAWRRVARAAPAGGRLRRLLAGLGIVTVVVLGAAGGWAMAPSATAHVGPLELAVDVRPTLDPGVAVDLPPVGRITFDTHSAPIAVQVRILTVDLDAAAALVESSGSLLELQSTAPPALQEATARAAAVAGGCALAGAAVALVAVYRRPRPTLEGLAIAVVGLLALGVGAVRTFDPAALAAPRFDGLLSRAPYVAGTSRDVAARLESYRSGVSDVVRSVTTLYAVAGDLPARQEAGESLTTLLHISDIHLNPLAFDVVDRLVDQFAVDAVVDTGDVTTWGSELESGSLDRIAALGVPYVFVRGNHDSLATQQAVAAQPNTVVLDGDVAEVAGLRIAGIGDASFTPEVGETTEEEMREELLATSRTLARAVRTADLAGPPVDIAMVHNPGALDPVFGEVPLVLAGHYHYRIRRVDPDSGTRVMVEGSSGGAGITSAGLRRLGDGEPLALTATLLRFAATGERAGQLVAYDEVTVGGLGLTSVTIERHVVPDESDEDDEGSGPLPGARGTP